MAKIVFRPGELTVIENPVVLEAPSGFAVFTPSVDELEELEDSSAAVMPIVQTSTEEEYSGPSVDEIREEAESFRQQWEIEKESMISSAYAESDRIIKEAEEAAFAEVKRKTGEAQAVKRQAEDESERIIAEAQAKAQEIQENALAVFENQRKEAADEGRKAGHEAGFSEGTSEVERLIQRTQTVLERAQDRRGEILDETEQQIIDLVLLVARKVVKVISESQRTVIISNIKEALKKVRGRGNILVKVNIQDLKLTTEYKKNFVSLLEGSQSIQIVEDTTVDSGGCIIETDFGEVDARISSQLAELEQKILEVSPIRSNPKSREASV